MQEPIINEIESRYADFLRLLIRMIEARADVTIPAGLEWQNDGRALAAQFAFHLHTIGLLNKGSDLVVDALSARIVDHGSVNVLARSAVEAYITYAFIFTDPDPEVCRFRHMAWQLGGLIDRQRLTATSAETRIKQDAEKALVDALQSELITHPLFSLLSPTEQKAFRAGKWTGGRHRQELAEAVGLHGEYFRNFYHYLCGYSHSSYAAALQVRDAGSFEVQRQLSTSILHSMLMVMAHFMTRFASNDSSAEQVLQASPDRIWVERYCFPADQFDGLYKVAP